MTSEASESKGLASVREFHQTFRMPIRHSALITAESAHRRVRLIAEELFELEEALEAEDIVETADALGDLLYVVYGSALEFGIDIDAVFDEIHRSNMTKAWTDFDAVVAAVADPEHPAEYFVPVWEDKYIVYGAKAGKVIKPPEYSPPVLEPLIEVGP